MTNNRNYGILSIPVIVGALGYFVDIYDLLLFSIVRKPSLSSLGLSSEQVTSIGENIISIQMAGLLIGGIIWGVMGDKKGRLSVLFGSIILYSIANIINGMVVEIARRHRPGALADDALQLTVVKARARRARRDLPPRATTRLHVPTLACSGRCRDSAVPRRRRPAT